MGGTVGTILFIVVMFGFMYFMMIRPQRKQQAQHQQMMSSLKKGDSVVTIGRLHGVVDSIDQANRTVTLDCDGIFLVFDLTAMAKVTPAAKPSEPAVSDSTSEVDSAAEVSDSAASSTVDSATSVADDPTSSEK